ncbi:MAG: hypothetical protein U0Z53_24140 [Blastocatellia bacterium]
MAWEQRGNRQYYYRKQRIGNRVVSIYKGRRTKTSELLATMDEGRRQERMINRQMLREEREEFSAMDAEIEEISELMETLVEATLVATGHYNHKGEWRRKRNGKKD